MGETTFASRVAAMMRSRDVELVSRSRIGTGLVSRGGRIFVVSYDECSEEEREILSEEALAAFLASADGDPWGYTASVVAQARDLVASANQTAIVRGWLAPALPRSRTRPFASALLGVEVTGEGTASVPVVDPPWFIDTTTWTTDAGVVRVRLRRDVQNDARPHEHALEVESPSFLLRFDWTAGDTYTHYTIEGADERVRDRIVDAVVKAAP